MMDTITAITAEFGVLFSFLLTLFLKIIVGNVDPNIVGETDGDPVTAYDTITLLAAKPVMTTSSKAGTPDDFKMDTRVLTLSFEVNTETTVVASLEGIPMSSAI